jgi:hypothetical protein
LECVYWYALLLLNTKQIVVSIAWVSDPLVSIPAGVPVLIVPRLLNFIVAGYPIAVGLLGLFDDMPIDKHDSG